jgi:hypothetical protein
LHRAWRDFRGHFNRQGYGVGIALAILGPLIFWLVRGSKSAEAQVAGWLLSGIVPLILLLAVTFLWQFIRAPYRQRDEAREQAAELEDEGQFPSHRIQIDRPFCIHYDTGSVVAIEVRFWNQTTRAMSLRLDGMWQRRVEGESEEDAPRPSKIMWSVDARNWDSALRFPVGVGPEDDVVGYLFFEPKDIPFVIKESEEDSQWSRVFLRPNFYCWLEIEDFISNSTTTETISFESERSHAVAESP